MGLRNTKRQGSDGMISATEIASWAYCPEAWRLQYGLGLKLGNQQALAAGTRHHRTKSLAERIAGWSIALGRAVIVMVAMLLILWFWWWR